MKETIWQHQLPNGLKLLLLPNQSEVAHVALFINVGSRDEEVNENGLAHFIEHTLFKGTAKRKSFHVLNRLESVGGDLNAYTSKEETCIYATVMQPFVERALELFADVVFHSVFPEKELEKEKQVVADEIDSYKDSPAEQIMDDFEESLFSGHSIGRNILGTKQTVRKFNRNDVLRFVNKHYHPSRMVVAVAGQITGDKLLKMIRRYFQPEIESSGELIRNPYTFYQPFEKSINRNGFQNHCVVGNLAYHARHPRRTALALLNNYLGGNAMTSRLNLMVREKYGLTYNIESGYQAYTDTGLFWIYFGTENGLHEKTLGVIDKELEKLRTSAPGTIQFLQAQKQFIGQITIAAESHSNRLMAYAKQWLLTDAIETVQETRQMIAAVTPSELVEVAREITRPETRSMLIFQSRKGKK